MSIQMAYGVRTKDYQQFNKGIPSLEKCVSVQRISIKRLTIKHPTPGCYFWDVKIDGRAPTNNGVELLVTNDGFDSISQFEEWFHDGIKGQIIHFTDFLY